MGLLRIHGRKAWTTKELLPVERRIVAGAKTHVSPLSLAIRLGVLGLVAGLASPEALAACSPANPGVNAVVTCTGAPSLPLTPVNNFSSSTNGLQVTVDAAARMNTVLGTVLSLTGSGITLTNLGVIDPAFLLPLSALTSGVVIGNASTSGNVSVTNSGTIRGTIPLLDVASLLGGAALNITNGANFTTSIYNSGTIGASSIGVSVLQPDEAPVVVVQGGSRVNMTNSGTVTGRIGFEASGAAGGVGNSFINAGTLNGGVSLGAGRGGNTFTAVTGSVVNAGTGISLGGLVNVNLSFAPSGKVDGGVGGTNNTLVLDNQLAGVNAVIQTGTASSSQYINFNKLLINGGTWTLQGALVNGSTILNSALVQFDNSAAFGSGVLNVNGGTLAASTGNLNVANNVVIGAGGLTVQGTNAFAFGGNLSGTGALRKNGTADLTLNTTNTYSGGTQLNAGTLVLGATDALGSGTLTASAGTNLSTGPLLGAAIALANGIDLLGNLTVIGSNALTLGGVIGGSGGLVKEGSGDLIISGTNSYQGNTVLNLGKLVVGADGALGAGALSAAAGTTLDANATASLTNQVSLNGAVTVGGTADLTLTGPIIGGGSLTKNGGATLNLSGNNLFLGGLNLNAGTLKVGSNTALGSGNLTVSGASSLDSSAAVALVNNIELNAGLTVAGSNALTLDGALSGTGTLTKAGTANLTLNGINTFQAGTLLNGGRLTLGNAAALGGGALTVGGAASLDNSAAFTLGNNITLNADLALAGTSNLTLGGVISGAGGLTKNGTADLTLSGNNTFTGALNILGGSVFASSAAALGGNSGLNIGAGASLNLAGNGVLGGLSGAGVIDVGLNNSLTVGGANTSSTFGGSLTGSGSLIKVGGGQLELTGINSLSGNTQVNAGILKVSNTLGSAIVDVNAGGTLTGGGSLLGALNINSGGHLALNSADTLSTGSLVVGSGANLDVSLGAPSPTPLLSVNGSVSLDGNLNVSNGGAFGAGIYRLINYTGSLAGQGLTVTGVPQGFNLGDVLVDIATANQVNVVVSVANMLFWDGSQTTGNGTVEGGNGTWSVGASNWTAIGGTPNSAWAGGFAVFTGTAGTVSVDGTQQFTGLQFASDGYNVVGGAAGQLTAVNGSAGNTAIRVDPTLTATLGVNIDGAGKLAKLDSGTLVLNGNNSYTGGTALERGALVVGSNTALGVGLLSTAAGTTLSSNKTVALGNDLALAGNLNVTGSNALALNGVISGAGGLVKSGTSQLTLGAVNTYLGPTALNAGGLILASSGALGNGALNAAGGTTLDSSTAVSVGNALNLGGNLSIGGSADLTLGGVISGSGSLTKEGAANLTLNGLNNYQGGLTLNAGTLTLGTAAALGTGGLTVTGNSTLASSTPLVLANDLTVNAGLSVGASNNLTLAGVLAGNGSLIKTGTSDLTLAGNNTFSGLLDIQAGSLTTVGNGALGNNSAINLATGTALNLGSSASLGNLTGAGTALVGLGNTLSLGANNGNGTFGGVLAGLGNVDKLGSGTLTLAGVSTLAGNTQVSAGTLNVNGQLASAGVNVNSGATLGGSGTLLGTVNVADGGHLAVKSGSVLTTGALVLGANANLDAGLGAPSTGGTELLRVLGNLTLDGTLNISDTGGFGAGIYRLINYTGVLTNNGLLLGSLPGGVLPGSLDLQTAIGNQINLLVNGNTNVQFWDGSQLVGNGTIEGGNGTWNAASSNWTELNGSFNLGWAPNSLAVFQGTAGTVTVDGAQAVTGLQFVTDGYNLVGGTAGGLTLFNGAGGNTAVRVDPTVTATLDVNLSGGGTLAKLDSGTLVLNGSNTFTGGTALNGGSLVVGNNNALGSGVLTAANGTTLDSNTALALTNDVVLNGSLAIGGSNALILAGTVSGAGSLIKNGIASLTLSGSNTYQGPTTLNAGGLILASSSALGAGALNSSAGTTLDTTAAVTLANALNLSGNLGILGTSDLTLNGPVNGAGGLIKSGSGNLTLAGGNGYVGGTQLNAGSLTVATGSALGAGALLVNGPATLDSSANVTLGNALTLNGTLTVAGSNGLTLGGIVDGAAQLIKNGGANLSLNGANSYGGGTLLNAGTLTLGSNTALGSGTLSVGGAATLDNSAPLVLANAIDLNADLTVAGSHDLNLAGVVAGNGALIKNGTAGLTLSGNNLLSGPLTVLGGSLTTVGSGALGNTSGVTVGSGATLNLGSSATLNTLAGNGALQVAAGNTLTVGGTNTFGGSLGGSGALDKVGTGTLNLTGNSGLTGATSVTGGTLNVAGSLASSSVTVNNGATLSGGGSLAGAVTVADGGHLGLSSASALTVGSLVLGGNANLDVGLGVPVVGGGSGLLNVGGDLVLDGNLNVSDLGGFGTGVYNLINYAGALTNNGLTLGTLPSSVTADDLQLQTVISNKVNLVVIAPNTTVQFWDGGQLIGNGAIDGGNGTWGNGTNWANVDGSLNQSWNDKFAVFQGAAGTVTVDGSQSLTGMQFVSDGYNLVAGTSGQLNLVNGGTGNTAVRVDPNVTATLGVSLNGSGTLAKLDSGTLVLNAANGYTGGTALNGGTLVVGNNNALGSGVLTAANGTTLASNSAVTLGNNALLNGAMTVGGASALTLDGVVSGNGSLVKIGASSLTLNGVNTYSGGTSLNAGQLTLGNNAALGSGALSVGGAAQLDGSSALQLANAIALGGQLTLLGSHDLTLSGALSGTASLVKNGNGALLLTGSNSYGGGTILNGGSTTGSTSSLQGAIANNAALTFEQNVDGTYTGNLTGSGSLTKTGSGDLLLTGNNSFTGSTNVTAGGLLVNGTLNSAAVQVASGASLGGSGQLAGAVSMADGSTLTAGTATPLSVGALALSAGTSLDFALGAPGASTTVVNVAGNLTLDGTLNISDAGGFGVGVYQLFRYGGSLTDNGLLLGNLPGAIVPGALSLQTALANQLNLLVQTAPGQIQFWNGTTTSPDGTVHGGSGTWGPGTNWTDPTGTQGQASNNQFAVFGGQGGTVTVAGNQSFTGLQVLDSGYTLVAGTGGSLSPTNAADGSLATVRINAGVTAEVSAPLVGSGGINKTDAGTLLLTGANTYSGGTTVSGGTLAGNTGSLQGAITNNANLLFQQDSNGQFNGTLTGTGTVVKQGNGSLLLTGNQPLSGAVAVNQGLLQVGNASNPGTVLGGQVTVANGAGLSGNGSVGSLVNHGVVTPDSGKLSVAGNFTNAADGTLNLVITPSVASSLAVGGSANLAGSLNVLNLVPYTGPTTYTLLTAGGGVTGTFTNTNLQNLAFLDTALNYSPNQVALAVSRNTTSFASVAATGNQRAVATALGSGVAVAGSAVQNALLTGDAANARAAFDSLSGEIHASTASALLEDSRYVRDAVNERMRQPGCYRQDDPRNSLAPSENRLSSAGCHGEMVGWMRVLGTWGHLGGDSNTARLDRNLSGFLLGTDKQLDDAWRAGIAAGYTRSDLDAKRRNASADVDSYHLMAYTAYQQEAFAARMGVGYTWHDIESKRDVAVGTEGQRLKADYKARSAQVFGEVGYTVEAGGLAVEPFAGLAYVNYASDTLKEKGGSAALKGDADQDITFSTLGVRLGKTIALGNGSSITPRGSIGWRHAFGDTQPDADLSFINGGASFSTQGVPIAKDSAVVEAGVDYQISPNGKLGLGYSGQLSRNDKDHGMTISFSLGF
ncbi:transporter [Pseudomonas sp. WS 5111]|nr:transporter [Pseudomonas sp. WS 5111]